VEAEEDKELVARPSRDLNHGQPCMAEEEEELVFGVVLSCPGPEGVALGRRSACRVSIVGERAGLPERVRLDWSRLRFPDAAWRLRRLGPKDMR
jgi:hypothetical protein